MQEGLRTWDHLFGPMGMGPLPDTVDFKCCAQFVVDRDTIKRCGPGPPRVLCSQAGDQQPGCAEGLRLQLLGSGRCCCCLRQASAVCGVEWGPPSARQPQLLSAGVMVTCKLALAIYRSGSTDAHALGAGCTPEHRVSSAGGRWPSGRRPWTLSRTTM